MNVKAISFAIQAHQNVNQTYGDGVPYSVHLSMVAYYAQKYKNIIPDSFFNDVYAACWLHDTIEDCRLTYNDIKKEFGEYVADIVYAVTNEKGKNRSERANDNYYKGIKKVPYAAFVKLCDRLANVAYSKEVNSSMYKLYQKENDEFVSKIIKNNEASANYIEMINELWEILGH